MTREIPARNRELLRSHRPGREARMVCFSILPTQSVRKPDFYAKIFVLNLVAVLTWVAQAIADHPHQDRRLAYRVTSPMRSRR